MTRGVTPRRHRAPRPPAPPHHRAGAVPPSAARRTPPAPLPRGFTLIELLVILVLLGIFAMLGMPRLNVGVYRADSAMHSVGSVLISAQRAAVARQHAVVVAIDAPQGRLRIHYDADNDGEIGEGELVRYAALPEGIHIAAPPAALPRIGGDAVSFTRTQDGLPAVTFHRAGSASEAGGFYLVAIDAPEPPAFSPARAIVVERATGRISWFRLSSSGWEQGF